VKFIFRRIEYVYSRLNDATVIACLAAPLIFLFPAGANASGFALKEQSTSAQGNSFAGATAGAEDVTYMFFNPAGLTRHADHQAALLLNYFVVQGETVDASGGVGGESTCGRQWRRWRRVHFGRRCGRCPDTDGLRHVVT
jgi:hypothetical protein